MELAWIYKKVGDGEGSYLHMHYLVNPENQQCLATIAEPRDGSILYVTDIRIAGVDRSWLTLEAAKHHCEAQAELWNIEQAHELEEKIKAPRAKVPLTENLD